MPSSVQVESFSKALDPPVRGFLHQPTETNGNALVLTHGAGGNAQAPLLTALAETFSATGFIVLRCNLPYRQMRSFGPPGPADADRDRAGLENAIRAVREVMSAVGDQKSRVGKIFLSGHSYGGRQSSMLCAQEPDVAAGLMLLSYPLHPSRRPEQQRTQHLPDLRTPTLFVHGTRDPFGTTEELERAIKMIPARTKLLEIEGGGHDLGFKGKAKKEELPKLVFSEFTAFFEL
jgi:uncharacterized protein